MDWTMPPPPSASAPTPPSASRWKRIGAGAGLIGAGLVAGGVLATTLSANAATNPTSSSTAATSEGGSTAPDQDGSRHHGGRLDSTGTVTAIGPASVTIHTSTATTTYAVTASSDIDKNGEAQLSDLKVGDAVRFNTTTSGGTTSIDKLHAGNEAQDLPPQSHGGDGAAPSGYGYGG